MHFTLRRIIPYRNCVPMKTSVPIFLLSSFAAMTFAGDWPSWHGTERTDGYGWACQNFRSGELVWNEKKALGKGAIAYADKRFYCQSGTGSLCPDPANLATEEEREDLDPSRDRKQEALSSGPRIALLLRRKGEGN